MFRANAVRDTPDMEGHMSSLMQNHASHRRVADLDPFDFKETRIQAARHPATIAKGRAMDLDVLGYGCVDWYLYPARPMPNPAAVDSDN